jgi:hypothetical protein
MRGRHSSRRDNPCHERSALPPCIISTSQQSEAAWLVPVVVAAAWLAACWLLAACLAAGWCPRVAVAVAGPAVCIVAAS